jgi:cyclase
MLRPRVIPCLLVKNKGLVKTTRFKHPKYVGDPINAVKIFNEKEVDELTVLDIDATAEGREPDYKMIENVAAECRMPLCYGGGVKTLEQAQRASGLGAEKVAVSSAAVDHPELVTQMAESLGSQSVVVVLDVKKRLLRGGYEVCTHNGQRKTGRSPIDLAREMESLGVGEIVINSIDHDGVMQGYDLELAGAVRDSVSVPLTVLGGAGSLNDVKSLIDAFGIIGASAGSLFVFKGIYRAVLINYPTASEKKTLIA